MICWPCLLDVFALQSCPSDNSSDDIWRGKPWRISNKFKNSRNVYSFLKESVESSIETDLTAFSSGPLLRGSNEEKTNKNNQTHFPIANAELSMFGPFIRYFSAQNSSKRKDV